MTSNDVAEVSQSNDKAVVPKSPEHIEDDFFRAVPILAESAGVPNPSVQPSYRNIRNVS